MSAPSPQPYHYNTRVKTPRALDGALDVSFILGSDLKPHLACSPDDTYPNTYDDAFGCICWPCTRERRLDLWKNTAEYETLRSNKLAMTTPRAYWLIGVILDRTRWAAHARFGSYAPIELMPALTVEQVIRLGTEERRVFDQVKTIAALGTPLQVIDFVYNLPKLVRQ